MKKSFKLFALLMALLLVVAFLPGCGGGGDDDEEGIPEEIQALMDLTEGLAEKYGKQLDGDFGDWHVALIESEEAEDFDGFEEWQAVLSDIREECGANYVYALYPSDLEDWEAPFFITVDGSEEADDYGFELEELEFEQGKAWHGIPATSSYAWEDDDGFCWTACAPIHDSEGNVVAVLGIDYPAPEIEDFPEWNVDSDDWNEFEW